MEILCHGDKAIDIPPRIDPGIIICPYSGSIHKLFI
jgi:hypothetical protein